MTNNVIFLGGSCNPTKWRAEIAIPFLEKNNIPYYNPQVDDWSEELVAIEADAKENAEFLLFVIDSKTRAIASMLEATEYALTGRNVLLIVDDIVDGEDIGDQLITGSELKDLNRGRAYLLDIAKRNNIPLFENVQVALNSLL